MEDKIEIIHGAPIPAMHGERANLVKQAFLKLEVGDSFIVASKDFIKVANTQQYLHMSTNMRFTTRKVDETHKQIWRTR